MEIKQLTKIIKELGFENPTEVQKIAFKYFKEEKSTVFVSPTGTGKTHAYLIPLLEQINPQKQLTQALILVPTNELAYQVSEMLKPIAKDISFKAITAREDRKRLIRFFANQQPMIVISTPGRLYDLVVKENVVKVHQAKYLILDEADMLFDYDFMGQISPVVENLTSLVYVFSATMPNNLVKWINSYFAKVEIIDLSDKIKLDIDHYLLPAGMDKDLAFFNLLETINPLLCLIFVSKNEKIDVLFEKIRDKGYNVIKLSAKMSVRERKTIIAEVKQLKYQYVVASDLAARGMDFEGVTHVINYQMPYQSEYYIHRSGRTGRMGAHGEVFSFFEEKEARKFKSLEKAGIKFIVARIRNMQIIVREKVSKGLSEVEIQAIRKIKKPARVKPGYRKKNKQLIEKALQEVRRRKRRKR